VSSSAANPPPGALEPPEDIHEDVDAAEFLQHRVGDRVAPSAVERSAARKRTPSTGGRARSARGHNLCSGATERIHDGGSHSPGSAGDERAVVGQLEIEAHD